MNDDTLKRFAAAITAAAPGITMPASEVEAAIKEHGLGHFIRGAGGHAAELAEMAELMSSLDGGG